MGQVAVAAGAVEDFFRFDRQAVQAALQQGSFERVGGSAKPGKITIDKGDSSLGKSIGKALAGSNRHPFDLFRLQIGRTPQIHRYLQQGCSSLEDFYLKR